MGMTLIIWGIGIGIPVAMLIFLLGWMAGFNHSEDIGNWGAGWDSGWDCGYDEGYICGIQDRRKDREQLKEKDRDAV